MSPMLGMPRRLPSTRRRTVSDEALPFTKDHAVELMGKMGLHNVGRFRDAFITGWKQQIVLLVHTRNGADNAPYCEPNDASQSEYLIEFEDDWGDPTYRNYLLSPPKDMLTSLLEASTNE